MIAERRQQFIQAISRKAKEIVPEISSNYYN